MHFNNLKYKYFICIYFWSILYIFKLNNIYSISLGNDKHFFLQFHLKQLATNHINESLKKLLGNLNKDRKYYIKNDY